MRRYSTAWRPTCASPTSFWLRQIPRGIHVMSTGAMVMSLHFHGDMPLEMCIDVPLGLIPSHKGPISLCARARTCTHTHTYTHAWATPPLFAPSLTVPVQSLNNGE